MIWNSGVSVQPTWLPGMFSNSMPPTSQNGLLVRAPLAPEVLPRDRDCVNKVQLGSEAPLFTLLSHLSLAVCVQTQS